MAEPCQGPPGSASVSGAIALTEPRLWAVSSAPTLPACILSRLREIGMSTLRKSCVHAHDALLS